MTRPLRDVALAIAVVIAAMGQIGHACADAAFRRGVGVHRPLNWANVLAGNRERYAWPPFAGPEHDVSDALIAQLREAGFDFVRLTVDPGPFLQMTGRDRDRLDDILKATIRRFRGRDLGVIVNFHSNSQVEAYRPARIFAGRETSLFRTYEALVARTARLLDAMDDPRIVFEPVNEPPAGYDGESAARWQDMMEALHRAVREQAPRLPVVVTGAQGGSRRGLMQLDPAPFRDDHTFYSFHYYEPHLLTHQGVVSRDPVERFRRYLADLPYPPRRTDEARVVAATKARIDADRDLSGDDRMRLQSVTREAIARYFDERWSNERIARIFDDVAAWASRHGIGRDRVILGEFGVTRGAGHAEGAAMAAPLAWLRDVRCAAQRHGFPWSVWELNGVGGMAIVDPGSRNRIDPVIRDALGLAAASSGTC